MSDNEYERFEIFDYDLENEFNPNRPRLKRTKNQQIYGIWAENSDVDAESDDGLSRRSTRRRSGAAKKSQNYTKPLSFVSGGIQRSTKKDKNSDVSDEDDKSNDQSNKYPDSDSKLGFQNRRQLDYGLNSDKSSPSADVVVKEKPKSYQKFKENHKIQSKVLGAWEQHTRGIGAKLLLQMGYKPGKGLGKDLQGIALPVQAHVRKGRGAIGAYGPEASASISKTKETTIADTTVKEKKESTHKWKRTDHIAKNATAKQYYYTSVEEIIEKGKKGDPKIYEKIRPNLIDIPVIDMTGPEKRILSGYHALGQSKVLCEDLYDVDSSRKALKQVNFELNELVHNLALLINMSEQEIVSIDKIERECYDRQEFLRHEDMKLRELSRLEEAHIETLNNVLSLIDELIDEEQKVSLERAEEIFLDLQSNYKPEYMEFNLADITAGAIAPLVKEKLKNWKPLYNPTEYIDLIKKWRVILSAFTTKDLEPQNVFDPYSSLVWAGVLPSFRLCIASWNPKEHQIMAVCLDFWAPLLPSWILDSILEKLILVCLTEAVEAWDPLTDTVPIHSWILPWHAILDKKLQEIVYPKIREKLGSALKAWVPQDHSARVMLEPWKDAFDLVDMTQFLSQHIIPKLNVVLSDFIINPVQQDFETWNLVWDWHKLIQPNLMGQMLSQYFFPNFLQVLVLWLNQSPDFDEISRWYNGWKNMLSEQVLQVPQIKDNLRKALEIMHRATNTVLPSLTSPKVINLTSSREKTRSSPPDSQLLDLHRISPGQLDFKDLILQKCSERGILFAPLSGRREMGKQIYRVGNVFCYIDRNVCMVSDGNFETWLPTSIVQLLDIAQG